MLHDRKFNDWKSGVALHTRETVLPSARGSVIPVNEAKVLGKLLQQDTFLLGITHSNLGLLLVCKEQQGRRKTTEKARNCRETRNLIYNTVIQLTLKTLLITAPIILISNHMIIIWKNPISYTLIQGSQTL